MILESIAVNLALGSSMALSLCLFLIKDYSQDCVIMVRMNDECSYICVKTNKP